MPLKGPRRSLGISLPATPERAPAEVRARRGRACAMPRQQNSGGGRSTDAFVVAARPGERVLCHGCESPPALAEAPIPSAGCKRRRASPVPLQLREPSASIWRRGRSVSTDWGVPVRVTTVPRRQETDHAPRRPGRAPSQLASGGGEDRGSTRSASFRPLPLMPPGSRGRSGG